MNEHIEVIDAALTLIPTMDQGLQHIYQRLKAGDLMATADLMQDRVSAFANIEKSLQPVTESMEDIEFPALFAPFRQGLNQMVGTYEQNDLAKAREVMQFTLLPAFNTWQAGMRASLERLLLQ